MKPDGDPRALSLGHLAILLVAGLVMTTGLIGDIARHVLEPPDTPDGVVGGWHLVVVVGVVVAAAGLGVGYTTDGPAFLRRIAVGTAGVGLSTAGLVLLFVWHRSVGVETRVQALVSPPHLVLFIGLGLVLLGPILAVARRGPQLGWTDSLLLWTPAIALLLTTNLVTGYASALAGGVDFDLGRLPPVVGESVSDLDLARGLMMILWLTATTTIAHAALLRRFRPRPGLIVVGFLALAIVPQLLDGDGGIGALSIGLVVAGVVVELAVLIHGRPTLGPVTAPMTMALMAAALWATTFLVLDFDERLRWSMPLTLGSIMLAVLAAAGASVLVGGPSAAVAERATDRSAAVSAGAVRRRRPIETGRREPAASAGVASARTRGADTTSPTTRQAAAGSDRSRTAAEAAPDSGEQRDRSRPRGSETSGGGSRRREGDAARRRQRAEADSAERPRPAGSRPPGRKREAESAERRGASSPSPSPTSRARGDDSLSERGAADGPADRRRTEEQTPRPRRSDTGSTLLRREAELSPEDGERPGEARPVARKATKRQRSRRPAGAANRDEPARERSSRGDRGASSDRATSTDRSQDEQPEGDRPRGGQARRRPGGRPPRPEGRGASTPRKPVNDRSEEERSERRQDSRPPRSTEETGRPDDSARPELSDRPEPSSRPVRSKGPARSDRREGASRGQRPGERRRDSRPPDRRIEP